MKRSNIFLLGSLGIFALVFFSKKSYANILDSSGTVDFSGNYTPNSFQDILDTISNQAGNIMTGQTRGERNNNPGNLRWNANINWQGQTGHDPGGYAMFDTPENGLRAMMIDVKNKIQRGLNTLNTLIPVYAPPSDNNPTGSYIANVSRWTGLGPDDVLDMNNVQAISTAMINMENGRMIYTQEQLDFAASSAGVA